MQPDPSESIESQRQTRDTDTPPPADAEPGPRRVALGAHEPELAVDPALEGDASWAGFGVSRDRGLRVPRLTLAVYVF